MIKEEVLLLIMGAVRYIRKEGDKRTESFVPKLYERVMKSICGVINESWKNQSKQGRNVALASNGVLLQLLIVSFLHRHPFQSVFPFIVNVVIEECKT